MLSAAQRNALASQRAVVRRRLREGAEAACGAVAWSAQTLVLSPDRRRVLLQRHAGGTYDGRWTGFIEPLPKLAVPPPDRVAAILARHSGGLIRAGDLRSVRCWAQFEFYELDGSGTAPNVELELVATLTHELVPPASASPLLAWFERDLVPYADMPKDDEVWYEPVLTLDDRAAGGDACKEHLRGAFAFEGQSMVFSEMELAGRDSHPAH